MRPFIFLALLASLSLHASQKISTLRVPEGGIQPQTVVDEKGAIHMIYFKGDAGSGDLYYVKSDDGAKFSTPLKVNSNPDDAIAIGNVRGAHLALGKGDRVHVAWMGSGKAPKGVNDMAPMMYTRLDDSGTKFEPERNVMTFATGLDGGGTVAADNAGNVYVIWHGDAGARKGETARQVWVAKSSDDGKTFAKEIPALKQATGACACCGVSAHVNAKGELYVLFRTAMGMGKMPDTRDMFLIVSKDKGATFSGADLHAWKLNQCAMSTSQLVESATGVLGAWETRGQIYFTKIAAGGQPAPPIEAPGTAGKRKHPAIAANAAGETVLAWTDGMAWQKGGTVEWQLYEKSGKLAEEKGKADGVPANSVIAAFAKPDGSFVIVY